MKVSVCIPTFNQAAYIEQTIKSCTQQTLKPFEILVSNDCSTDNTLEVLKRLSQEISILKVINQPGNRGMVPNTDAVLRAATGDYIVKLDSDDYLATTYIEKLSGLLDEHSSAGYAHGAVQEINGKGEFKKQRILARKTGFHDSDKALRNSIYGYQVAANIIMFRRSALEKVGFITAETNFAEDFYLSAQLAAANYGNVYFSEVLSYYRVWEDDGKVRQRRKLAEIIALRKVFEEVIEPAFKKRNWGMEKLYASKVSFACSQADCLGWKLYTGPEKDELAKELAKLSSAPKVKLYMKMYLNKFGGIIKAGKKIITAPKLILKTAYFFYTSRLRSLKS